MDNENIARIAHEVNRAYCNGIGDTSQLAWEDAPEWQRTSAINGVQFIRDNPSSTPADSHESWLAEKVAAGWVYGDVKDPEAKTHPCMLPYNELPAEQRMKDTLFQAVVRSLLASLEETVAYLGALAEDAGRGDAPAVNVRVNLSVTLRE